MNLTQFYNTYLVGKSYDYKNTGYRGQCVSLAKHYFEDVLEFKPQAIGNAKDYANISKSKYLQKNFKKVKNSKVQRGDVFVRTTGTYGHIGIVWNVVSGVVKTLEQNHGGCLFVTHENLKLNKNYVVLRPKNQKNIDPFNHPPKVIVNEVVKLKTDLTCYIDNKASSRYNVESLLKGKDAIKKQELRKVLKTTSPKNTAIYKANSRVTVKKISKWKNGTIMIKTPSCWLKIYNPLTDTTNIY